MKWNYAQNPFPLLLVYRPSHEPGFCEDMQMLHSGSQKVVKNRASRSHSHRLQWWLTQYSALSSAGKLKTEHMFNPRTEQQGGAGFICLVSCRTFTRDDDWGSTVSKPATAAVPTALLMESLNALLFWQSASKPDLVAVSYVFIKQG